MIISLDYTKGLIGGILYNTASILDGCDGEIARIKFKESKIGKLFDDLSDFISNACVYIAISFIFFKKNNLFLFDFFINEYLQIIVIIINILFLSFHKFFQYYYLVKIKGSFYIKDFKYDFEETKNRSFLKKIFYYGSFFARDDAFAYFIMICGILGIYHLGFIVITLLIPIVFLVSMIQIKKLKKIDRLKL